MTSLISFLKMSKENKIKTIKKEQYNLNKRAKRIKKNLDAVDFGVKKFEEVTKDIKALGKIKLRLIDEEDLNTLFKKLFVVSSFKSMTVRGAVEINKNMAETMGNELYNRLGTNENRSRWWRAFNRLRYKFENIDSEFDYSRFLTLVRHAVDLTDHDITYEIVDSNDTDMTGNPIPEFRLYKNGKIMGDDKIGAFMSG